VHCISITYKHAKYAMCKVHQFRRDTQDHVDAMRWYIKTGGMSLVVSLPSTGEYYSSLTLAVSELSDTQNVDRSQTTSFLFQFTEDTSNRDRFKKHLVPEVFSRFRN